LTNLGNPVLARYARIRELILLYLGETIEIDEGDFTILGYILISLEKCKNKEYCLWNLKNELGERL
tara:strand:- start:306 stop:503 length:198 start_codon:yes stop_codon:yes gene_type:complete